MMYPDASEPLMEQSEFVKRRRKARRLCRMLFSGPVPFRAFACFGGVLSSLTSVISVEERIVDESFENVVGVVLGIYGILFGFVVVLLETAGSSPSLLQNRLHYYAKFLAVIWGRSILYMVFGSLQLINATMLDHLGGGLLIGVGIIGFIIGTTAHFMLRAARKKTSVAELRRMWDEADKCGDGYLSRSGLVSFWEKGRLEHFGADLSDYLLVSSQEIYPIDQKVTFVEIYSWLTGITLEGEDAPFVNERSIAVPVLVGDGSITKSLVTDDTSSQDSTSKEDKSGGSIQATARNSMKDKFSTKYAMGQELARGEFSIIYEARNFMTDEVYAVKSILKADLTPEELTRLRNEAVFMNQMKHKSILHMVEYFDEDDAFYYVMELMKGGLLFNKIVENTFYPEDKAKVVFRTLLEAIEYLHSYGVVHRDIKPEHLLLRTPEFPTDAVLNGFEHMGMDADNTFSGNVGTVSYMAPEVMKEEGTYGIEIDMWSAGITLYILLCGYRPFESQDKDVLREKIQAGVYQFEPEWWDPVSNEAKDLVASLLVVDPTRRLTASKALQHSWFNTDNEGSSNERGWQH